MPFNYILKRYLFLTGAMPENWWAVDIESFHNHSPAVYCMDALEDTEVRILSTCAQIRAVMWRQFVSQEKFAVSVLLEILK